MNKKLVYAIAMSIAMAGTLHAQSADYLFSTDLGSDLDMSDPVTPGGTMDCGAIYRPGTVGSSAPVLWKDDDSSTTPWPAYPLVTGPQPAPALIGTSAIVAYESYFDLDAEDQLMASGLFNPGEATPLEVANMTGVRSIYDGVALSFDDDGANGWAVSGDVPTTATPNRSIEVYTTSITVPPGPPSETQLLNEGQLSLAPAPGSIQVDDDVDALDWHPLYTDPEAPGAYQARYFSPDHEANMTLDPGDIYLTTRTRAGQNSSMVYDDVMHFGVLDDTDIDAFEFVAYDFEFAATLGVPIVPGEWAVGALFSVDQDDGDTPAVDESGGLDPNTIYLTDLMGNYTPVSGSYSGDIDALAMIPEPSYFALIFGLGAGLLAMRRRSKDQR